MIRKVIIGSDVKNASMVHTVGQSCIDHSYEVCEIKKLRNGDVHVYISKGEERQLWKTYNAQMPMSLEHDVKI